MAYYVKGKTYTDHPLMDEICYNCKLILKSIVIKNDVLAMQKETKNSLGNAEMFFLMHDKSYIDFDTFNFTREIYEAYGYDNKQIKKYLEDRYSIPVSDRDSLTQFANEYFKANFEEENDYYRMLMGLPPFNTGEEYYIWLTSSDIPANYSKQVHLDLPLHEQPIDLINLLYENGTIDNLRKIFVGSNYSYMMYLGSRKIDLYTARKAAKWDILYMPNVYYLVRDKFIDFYKVNRETYMTRSYQEFFSQSGEYYDQMMILIVLAETFSNLIADTPQWYIRRDIFDLRSCKYFLESSGVEYFKIIPLKYQIRIVKNLNRLIKYKSSNQNIEDIIDIFDSPNTKIYRYWLYKKIGSDPAVKGSNKSDSKIKVEPKSETPIDDGVYDFGDIDVGPGSASGDYDYGDLDNGTDPDTVVINDKDYDFNIMRKDPEPEDPDDPDILPGGNRIDSSKGYTLEFIASDYRDSYDDYIKDNKFRTYYDDITLQDKYWDGEDSHEYVKNKILEQDFTIQGTKYMSVEYQVSMKEWLYQSEYMLGMIMDSKLYDSMSDIRIAIPSIDENATFKLSDLFLFLVILSNTYYRNDINGDETLIRVPDDLSEGDEPTIDQNHYAWKKKYFPEMFVQKNGRIHGFNSTLDKNKLIEVLERRHSHLRFGMPDEDGLNALNNEEYKERADKWLSELGVFDFIVPDESISSIEDLVTVYETNTDIYNKIREASIHAANQDDRKYLDYIFQELFTRPFDTDFYTIIEKDGTKKEYKDLVSVLQERDYLLYDVFMTINTESNIETKQDLMRSIMNDAVDTLDYYLSSDGFPYLYSFVSIESFGAMVKYIYLIIGFFKSYKVYFLDPYYTLQADDELENSVRPVDVINEYKITNRKWDKHHVADAIGAIKNTRSLSDLGESEMHEIADIYAYYDPDPLMDFDLNGIDAEKGEIEEVTDIDCGTADPTSTPHYTTFNGGKSYLGIVNIRDLNGGNANEDFGDYYSINGGEAYDPDVNKTDAMGSQKFNYIIDGGAAGKDEFISNTFHLKLVGTELAGNVIISKKKENVLEIKPDGLYVSDSAFGTADQFNTMIATMNSISNNISSESSIALEDIEVLLNPAIRHNRIMSVLNPITENMEYVNKMMYNDTFIRELNQFVDSLVASLNAKYNDDILNVYAWEELN